MGTATDAHCYACGYDAYLQIGGGIRTFQTLAFWPFACDACHEVVVANTKETRPVCRACGTADILRYGDPLLSQGPCDTAMVAEWDDLTRANGVDGETSDAVAGWGDMSLSKGRYRCPRCGAFALRFGTDFGHRGRLLWD